MLFSKKYAFIIKQGFLHLGVLIVLDPNPLLANFMKILLNNFLEIPLLVLFESDPILSSVEGNIAAHAIALFQGRVL